VIEARSSRPDPLGVDLTEARTEIGEVGDSACPQQAVVGQRVAHPDPQSVRVEDTVPLHGQGVDLDHVEQDHALDVVPVRRGRPVRPRQTVERTPGSLAREGGEHREDHLAVLHGSHVTRRERAAVPIAVDVEDDGALRPALPKEVPVERVGEPALGNGHAGGPQRLRRHLPAEQPVPVPAYVEAPEEIAVEYLEVEQFGQRARDGQLRHPATVALRASVPRRSDPPRGALANARWLSRRAGT
jgi:hypothetical protein